MSRLLGKGLGKLVVTLLKSVLTLVGGLLQGLASPITEPIKKHRRKSRRKRDVAAVKRDWKAIRKGKLGKGGSKLAVRSRKRAKKRLSSLT